MWGKGLLTGMGVTLKHCFGKKETVQYPEEKLPMSDRFRGGQLLVEKDKCIGCKLCSIACQNQAITLDVSVDENKKRHLEKYVHHSGRCMYCNLCVEACAMHCLTLDKNYENAVYHKKDTEYDCIVEKKQQEVKEDE